MHLTHVILGEILTEKAERLKARKVHVLRVHPRATKVDVAQALRRHYGVEPRKVNMVRIRPKERLAGRGKVIRKRDASRRALVTLSAKSKAFDISSFQT